MIMSKSNKEVTGARVASAASKVLASSKSTKLEKRAAASALTQHPDGNETANAEMTHRRAASAAGKVLANPDSSPAAKSAAGSALTQHPDKH